MERFDHSSDGNECDSKKTKKRRREKKDSLVRVQKNDSTWHARKCIAVIVGRADSHQR